MSHHNLDAITVHQARQPFDVPGLDDFEWAQETDTSSFFFSVGAGVRGRDLLVRMLPTTLCVRCHGRILLDGPLGGTIAPEESEWELVDGSLHLTLRKAQQCEWRIPIRQTTATTTPGTAPAATSASAPSRPASSATAPPPQPRRLPALDGSAGGSSVLRDAYRAWDRFDEVGALAAVENEGKSEDSIGVTLRAGGGTAALQCTDYVKDTEEVELDEELGRKRSSLQATLNARLAQAAELKAQGNRLLSDGQPRAALERYLEGEGALCALEHARVLCSAHMVGTTDALLTDLRANAAQAALKLGDWDAAIETATAVLEAVPTHAKALSRRASAHASRDGDGDASRARADLRALLKVQPSNGRAASRLLDSLPADSRGGIMV